MRLPPRRRRADETPRHAALRDPAFGRRPDRRRDPGRRDRPDPGRERAAERAGPGRLRASAPSSRRERGSRRARTTLPRPRRRPCPFAGGSARLHPPRPRGAEPGGPGTRVWCFTLLDSASPVLGPGVALARSISLTVNGVPVGRDRLDRPSRSARSARNIRDAAAPTPARRPALVLGERGRRSAPVAFRRRARTTGSA